MIDPTEILLTPVDATDLTELPGGWALSHMPAGAQTGGRAAGVGHAAWVPSSIHQGDKRINRLCIVCV